MVLRVEINRKEMTVIVRENDHHDCSNRYCLHNIHTFNIQHFIFFIRFFALYDMQYHAGFHHIIQTMCCRNLAQIWYGICFNIVRFIVCSSRNSIYFIISFAQLQTSRTSIYWVMVPQHMERIYIVVKALSFLLILIK